MNSQKSNLILFVVGPTAVGKSSIALKLAQSLNAEIVSCDSMQVYREISIASSKPTADEQKKIRHHLIDQVSVEEKFDVATFNQSAGLAIENILKSGKVPLVVGGSGMYMQVLLDGIFETGEGSPLVRKELESRAKDEGLETLYAELQEADPAAAQKIHPNDQRRIVRALEVFLTTAQPISKLQASRKGLWGKYPIRVFALNRERENLYALINERVEKMFKLGLLNEVAALKGKELSLTAERIIGVKEITAFLNKQCSLEEAKERMKMNTRRLAKRQLTWFRKDKRLHWIDMDDKEESTIVNEILKELETA